MVIQDFLRCVISDLAPFLSQMQFSISPMIASAWPNVQHPGGLCSLLLPPEHGYYFTPRRESSVSWTDSISTPASHTPLSTRNRQDESQESHQQGNQWEGNCRALSSGFSSYLSVHSYGQTPQSQSS